MRSICTVTGCGKPINARGLCYTHYGQAQRGARPFGPRKDHGYLELLELVDLGLPVAEAARRAKPGTPTRTITRWLERHQLHHLARQLRKDMR